jgi:hypothetical protein
MTEPTTPRQIIYCRKANFCIFSPSLVRILSFALKFSLDNVMYSRSESIYLSLEVLNPQAVDGFLIAKSKSYPLDSQ